MWRQAQGGRRRAGTKYLGHAPEEIGLRPSGEAESFTCYCLLSCRPQRTVHRACQKCAWWMYTILILALARSDLEVRDFKISHDIMSLKENT